MAEEMFAAALPFVVVDPAGSWVRAALVGRRQGARAAIPIFGGKHADVPLERGAGELLADLVVEKRLMCVLDREGPRISFNVTACARLVRSRRECRTACASPRSELSTIRATCAAARRHTHSSPSDLAVSGSWAG